MKYAVIKTGGKQYKVSVGSTLNVELLGEDKSVIFDEVLLVVDGDKVEVGMPHVAGTKVFADVISQVKADKIEVFKYKSKSRYRKHTGHRQHLSAIKITGIGAKVDSSVAPKAVSPKTLAKKPATKKAVVKKTPVKKSASK